MNKIKTIHGNFLPATPKDNRMLVEYLGNYVDTADMRDINKALEIYDEEFGDMEFSLEDTPDGIDAVIYFWDGGNINLIKA